MWRTSPSAALLVERMCRPQRVGVFGHRGVGKTTLLTMLYREAVGGRLPDLRLAGADARTAEYLSEKILQLETGRALPGTLAETDLRFQLYHRSSRVELLVRDYQGEHVALGRAEPIRDFLRDCDVVWICLDAGELARPADCLRRQQEVEQLVEDYLATEPARELHRPMALVLTKADLLEQGSGRNPEWLERLGMTRHALQSHCPHNGSFAVSALGAPPVDGAPVLSPVNLAEPLTWLANALQAQDEARIEWLWSHASGQGGLLVRAVACFARRYPEAEATAFYRKRLIVEARRRRWRRALAGVGSAAGLLACLWTYDAYGYHQASKFEADHTDEPAASAQHWRAYQKWHPTRQVLWGASARAENNRLHDLDEQARAKECEQRLADLRRLAADMEADPEEVWRRFHEFHAAFPETELPTEVASLRARVEARRDKQLAAKALRAYDELRAADGQAPDLAALIELTDRFLKDYAQSAQAEDVRRRRDACLSRLEDRDLEAARAYSAHQPLNFQTRRELYQRYLDRHPDGGLRSDAEEALRAIETEWDKNDFRAVRDHFVAHPDQLEELNARCQHYLAVHPHGKFAKSAQELLRWSEKVAAPGRYRVALKGGEFDRKIAYFFSRGPDLSVEIEVAGVRYGPSQVIKNQYNPDWDYEFPRPIRWKLGDPVRIRVYDHDYWKRKVVEISSDDGDPLALRLLSGEAWSGPNHVTFESDFTLPTLPRIE
jgi:GTPase SAR1 family protein